MIKVVIAYGEFGLSLKPDFIKQWCEMERLELALKMEQRAIIETI